MVRIGILEDDIRSAALLKENIDRFSQQEKVDFSVVTFHEANALLEAGEAFDLLFMDIEMPGIDGFEAARRIRERDDKVSIIFVTNMVSYAPKGYSVNAMDFIVKPVEYSTFYMKMTRALAYIKRNGEHYITLHKDKKLLRHGLRDLSYVESQGHTLFYHFSDGVIDVRGKLAEQEKEIAAYGFARCNSCYLVNFAYISSIERLSVFLHDGTELRMSRAKRKDFLKKFGDYLGGGQIK